MIPCKMTEQLIFSKIDTVVLLLLTHWSTYPQFNSQKRNVAEINHFLLELI